MFIRFTRRQPSRIHPPQRIRRILVKVYPPRQPYRDLLLAFTQQLAPDAVHRFPAHLPFAIRHPLRRAVRLTVEPEDFRCFHAINTRQRIVAVLTAIDTGQRHVPVHFLQQAEPFPDKPGADRLAGWLSAQHLASRFADASTERIVAVVPAGLAVILLHGAAVNVIAPANAVQLRQEVVRNLRSRAFQRVTGSIPAPLLLSGQRAVLNKLTPGAVVLPAVPAERVIVPLFPHQVITVVIIPARRDQQRGDGRCALPVNTSRRCSRPRRSYSLRVVSRPRGRRFSRWSRSSRVY